MSRVLRTTIPQILVIITCLIVWGNYFYKNPTLSTWSGEVSSWAVVIAGATLIAGIISLTITHGRVIQKPPSTESLFLSVILLAGMFITIAIGQTMGIGSVPYKWIYNWVFYALLVKTLVKTYRSFTLAYYATLFGVLILLPFSLIEDPIPQVGTASMESILGILYMGIFASGLGYMLYNTSVDKIGPTKTSSFVYSLVPVLVSIQASLIFREPITAAMGCSVILIIIGLRFMLDPDIKSP